MSETKPGWMFYRSKGCQLHVHYPGEDDPGRPIQKAVIWLVNPDLSSIELRSKNAAALADNTHEHVHARGIMYVKGEGSQRVAQYTGQCTGVQGAVYAKACRKLCWSKDCYRREHKDKNEKGHRTELQQSAVLSAVANQSASSDVTYHTAGIRQFLIKGNDVCIDLDGNENRASLLLKGGACLVPSAPSAGAR